MSLVGEDQIIRAHWETMWVAGAVPKTPTQHQNDPWVEPKFGSWARLTFRHGDAYQASFGAPGGNTFRAPGIVLISLYTEPKKGSAELRELGDLAVSIFRSRRLEGGILFRTPSFVLLDPKDCKWAEAIVRAPYIRDEVS